MKWKRGCLGVLRPQAEAEIPKWFFYAFCPGHLFIIFLARTVMGI